ncbi:MAG: DHH family phosphoesterase [bacterium]
MIADNQRILTEIETLLVSNNHFFLGSHVYPDGDNVGSLIAMRMILGQLGKSSYIFSETMVPKMYAWIPETKYINNDLPQESCEDFDLIVTVDASDLKRLGEKFIEWNHCKSIPILNIDHHITNTNFGDVNWATEDYASTGEQIFELARHLDVRITKPMAIALYTSIATDTGSFSYANTNSRTLRYASELVDLGANPNEIFRNVYANRSLEALKLESEAFKTFTFIEDMKLGYVYITQEMLKQVGATVEESEGIIEHLGVFGESVRNVMFFKELSTGEIKISVRTKDGWDASRLCKIFGGGGHPKAGGFQLFEPIEKAIELSLSAIRKAIEEGILPPF